MEANNKQPQSKIIDWEQRKWDLAKEIYITIAIRKVRLSDFDTEQFVDRIMDGKLDFNDEAYIAMEAAEEFIYEYIGIEKLNNETI